MRKKTAQTGRYSAPNPWLSTTTPAKFTAPPDSEATIIANVQAALNHALDPNVPALFSAIAAHFMVEYTHPFYDGNGRLGRYLLVAHLGQTLDPADDPHPAEHAQHSEEPLLQGV